MCQNGVVAQSGKIKVDVFLLKGKLQGTGLLSRRSKLTWRVEKRVAHGGLLLLLHDLKAVPAGVPDAPAPQGIVGGVLVVNTYA